MHIPSGPSPITDGVIAAPPPGDVDAGDDRIAGYDYALPEELIAQRPAPRRDGSRLMVVPRRAGGPRHLEFGDLPGELAPGDVLVVNDTRVIRARLVGTRPGGGRAELLLARPATDGGGGWEALVRPSARLRPGTPVRFGEDEAWTAWVGEDLPDSLRRVRLEGPGEVSDLLERCGRIPLPPYVRRAEGDAEDADRYQTVYAREPGAVAAPTAGLHFTPASLDAVRRRGVEVVSVTLHVGPGTFLPVRVDRLSDHRLHAEAYRVPVATARSVARALREGGRVVAVGTTACRALEAWGDEGMPEDGAFRETRLMVWPGRPPRVTTALLTNFHLPRTTLLALVAAFAGRERVLSAYREAVRLGYRFYSYGDATLFV